MSSEHTGQRVVIVLLLAQQFLGCAVWRVQQVTPERVFQEQQPRNVRITTSEGSMVELREPVALVGDTLAGFVWARGSRQGALRKLPLDSVRMVAVREVDPVRTSALIGAAVGAAGGIVVAVDALSEECDPGAFLGELCDLNKLAVLAIPTFAAVGAGLGWLVAQPLKSERRKQVPAERFRLSITPQPDRQFVIGASVRF